MQVNLILNVEVGTPMADFGSALQRRNLHNRVCKEVMHDNVLLVFLDERSRRGWRNVAERAIGNRGARFCREIVGCKRVQTLGGSVRDNAWRRRAVLMLHNERDGSSDYHVPHFDPLSYGLVWTENEQVTLVLERLIIFLRGRFGPRIGGMGQDGLDNKVDRAIHAQRF